MLRAAMIALLLSAASVAAQSVAFGGMQQDRSAPVEVSADNLAVNQADGSAVFTGNVVIGQGDMRLAAERVKVIYGEGGQDRIRALQAEGSVTLVSGDDAAESASADYDVDSGIVVLSGDVVLTQGRNVLTGNRVRVDLNTGTAQAEGRVRSVLQPGGK